MESLSGMDLFVVLKGCGSKNELHFSNVIELYFIYVVWGWWHVFMPMKACIYLIKNKNSVVKYIKIENS